VEKTITKGIFFTGHETYRRQTYDRWTNLLVRSCWEFLFRWRNLGSLPFRICRRASVVGIRVAANPKVVAPRGPACSNLPRLVRCGSAGTCRTRRTFPPRYIPLLSPRNDSRL